MPVYTSLTTGWPATDAGALTARQALEDPLLLQRRAEPSVVIHRCEAVFRRRAGGFDVWKEFLHLVNKANAETDASIDCRFDAFAFAFLSTAKNADLLLPMKGPPFAEARFESELSRFFEELDSLASFEGVGMKLADKELKARYLSAREILVRPTCRDERRVVATMFVNGPSNATELADDLGISPSLASRTLAMLHNHQCVKAGADEHERFVLDTRSLAVNYFLVQETLGFSIARPLEQYVGLHR